jgi:hypothetical protein
VTDYLTSVTDATANRTSPDLAFLQETENFRIRVAADHEVVERVVLEGGRRDFRHALELLLCSGHGVVLEVVCRQIQTVPTSRVCEMTDDDSVGGHGVD